MTHSPERTGQDLLDRLEEIARLCRDHDWCFSVGSTRIGLFDCRIFPISPHQPIIVKNGKTMIDSIEQCLGEARKWLQSNERLSA